MTAAVQQESNKKLKKQQVLEEEVMRRNKNLQESKMKEQEDQTIKQAPGCILTAALVLQVNIKYISLCKNR